MKRFEPSPSITLELSAVSGGGGYTVYRVVRVPRSSGQHHESRDRREPRRDSRPEPQPSYYYPSGTAPRGLSNRREDTAARDWAASQARER